MIETAGPEPRMVMDMLIPHGKNYGFGYFLDGIFCFER